MDGAFPPDVETFVRQSLQSGEVTPVDDLMLTAVRVLREVKERHEALRRDIASGLASLDGGEDLDIPAMKSELSEWLRKKRINT